MSWKVFEKIAEGYDDWYNKHWDIYMAELSCLTSLIKRRGSPCLEVGVGTGRFSGPLGLEVGLDAAFSPLLIARERCLEVVQGIAEQLPFRDSSFECVVIVTSLCFLADPVRALREIKRVLRKRGHLYICFIPKESPLGRRYTQRGLNGDPIYSKAKFLSREQVLELLNSEGFLVMDECHTLIEEGRPSFVCVEAISPRG